jgi:hypothetical protein
MIVDDSGLFISQRRIAKMALVVPSIDETKKTMKLSFPNKKSIDVPLHWNSESLKSKVWQDEVDSFRYSEEVSQWLTEALETPAHLVRIAQANSRMRTKAIHPAPFPVTFADSGPLLLANESSLNAVNTYSSTQFHMTRFRPNIVTSSPKAFEEETWGKVKIGKIEFNTLYPCDRCPIVTIDQFTAEKDKQAFQALAKYRKDFGLPIEVIFGMRMIPESEGILSVGDAIDAF